MLKYKVLHKNSLLKKNVLQVLELNTEMKHFLFVKTLTIITNLNYAYYTEKIENVLVKTWTT